MASIPTLDGFNPLRGVPLDARTITTDRTSIAAGQVFQGMIVYDSSEDEGERLYVYNGTTGTNVADDWLIVRSGSASTTFELDSIVLSNNEFNENGATIDFTITGDPLTQFDLSFDMIEPAGWITDITLSANSGTIPNTREFTGTMTFASTELTVNRVARLVATSRLDPDNSVNTGLFRQIVGHGRTGNDPDDVVASFELDITGSIISASTTILGGDAPYTVELFDVNPSIQDILSGELVDSGDLTAGTFSVNNVLGSQGEAENFNGATVTIGTTEYTVATGTFTFDADGTTVTEIAIALEGAPDISDDAEVGTRYAFYLDPPALQTATVTEAASRTNPRTHPFEDISARLLSEGDHTYFLRISDSGVGDDEDVLIETETINIFSNVDSDLERFTNYYTTAASGTSLRLSCNYHNGEADGQYRFGIIPSDSIFGTVFITGADGTFGIDGINAGPVSAITDFTITREDVSPNVVETRSIPNLTTATPTFSDLEVGFATRFLPSSNTTTVLASSNTNRTGTFGVMQYGIDWVSGEVNTVPPQTGDNRIVQNISPLPDFNSGIIIIENTTQGFTSGTYTIRPWIADGTDLSTASITYGQVRTFTIT